MLSYSFYELCCRMQVNGKELRRGLFSVKLVDAYGTPTKEALTRDFITPSGEYTSKVIQRLKSSYKTKSPSDKEVSAATTAASIRQTKYRRL